MGSPTPEPDEDDHGCCAFVCPDCNGAGRTGCYPDDLGCDCGICDGDGYCIQCSGHGYHNEFGDPCFVSAEELEVPRG